MNTFRANYCDYCDCESCLYGDQFTHHALTMFNDYICDVCWFYSICMAEKGGPPCSNLDCIHRPRLIEKFHK